MWRRVLEKISSVAKLLRMTEPATSSLQEGSSGRKRPHEGNKDKPKSKKGKMTPSNPFTGRTDRKRKVALMFGYCGKGYYGLQVNKGMKTIEGDLLQALVKVGVIPQDHADNMNKMSFQRASRTDKGVSAVGNVASLKINDTVLKLNEALPEQIRIFGYKRTTNGFDCKNYCCARTYIYLLPTFSFAPCEKFVTNDYRVTDDIIDKVNEVLLMFKGTHNFHNYTSQIKPKDPSAKRYIMDFECSKPFVREGMEFAQIKVKGQSFMMHQIRKMIGITIAIVKGYCGTDVLEKSWGPDKVDIPKAPGLGLVLEALHFDAYNKFYGKDGVHEPVDWTDYKTAIEDFKEKFIISEIVKTEKEEGCMLKWLGTLHFHKLDVFDPSERSSWFMRNKLERLDKQANAKSSEDSLDKSDDDNNLETKSDDDDNLETKSDEQFKDISQIELSTDKMDRTSNVGHCDSDAEKLGHCDHTVEGDDVTETDKNRTDSAIEMEVSDSPKEINVTDKGDVGRVLTQVTELKGDMNICEKGDSQDTETDCENKQTVESTS